MTGDGAYPAQAEGPVCPVCHWPCAAAERTCRICGWQLLSEYIAGPASPEDDRELASRLMARCQEHDLRAAVRSLKLGQTWDASRLASFYHLIRGGQPSAEKVDRLAAEVAVELAEPASMAGAGFALARLMSGEVDGIVFVEVGLDGMSAGVLLADDLGRPRQEDVAEVVPWSSVMPRLAADLDLRRFQLAGGIGVCGDGTEPDTQVVALGSLACAIPGDNLARGLADLITGVNGAHKVVAAGIGYGDPVLDVVLVRRTLRWAALEAVAGQARQLMRPVADIFQGSQAGVLAEIVEKAACLAPLRYSYELILVAVDAQDGAVTIDSCELFPPGAAIGSKASQEATVELVTPPHAADELLLPIVVRRGEKPSEWPLIQSLTMARASTKSTRLQATLLGPGQITVQTSPVAPHPSARAPAWPDVLDALPERLPRSGPIDVAFLVELAGEPIEVESRVRLVRDVVDHLVAAAAPGLAGGHDARVAIAGYRDHYSGYWPSAQDDRHKLIIFHGLNTVGAAREILSRDGLWGAVRRAGSAAPIECALRALWQDRRAWRDDARHLLVVVGSRPPHPPVETQDGRGPSDCEVGEDWKHYLGVLRDAHGVECVTIGSGTEPQGSDFARAAWSQLGSDGLFTIAAGGMARLVQKIGLAADARTAAYLTLASRAR